MDETRRLREITLLFFREAMGSLAVLQEDMEAFPNDEEARKRWMEEIRQFAIRAESLSHRWNSVYMRIGKPQPPAAGTEPPECHDTPSP